MLEGCEGAELIVLYIRIQLYYNDYLALSGEIAICACDHANEQ
jgi:hypothetical protein